ncbi:MAG TPA: helix-turn-helix transcriptional regulator [Candidatus Competibacteraceae bacterium]|nr:helix-turn-helix transcriptional regulator [Candidatus Competibacteraceae bacterium]
MVDSNVDGFTARLREALQASGMNHSALATAVGVTPQAVSKWFKQGRMARSKLVAVANALGVSVEWLLTGRERPPAAEDLTRLQQRYSAASAEIRQLIDTVLQRAQQGDLSNGLAGAVRQLLNELPIQGKQTS